MEGKRNKGGDKGWHHGGKMDDENGYDGNLVHILLDANSIMDSNDADKLDHPLLV